MKKQSFKVFKRFVLDQERGDPHPGATEQQGLEQQSVHLGPGQGSALGTRL